MRINTQWKTDYILLIMSKLHEIEPYDDEEVKHSSEDYYNED